jgi:uncharacterized delta-60 repeat protein
MILQLRTATSIACTAAVLALTALAGPGASARAGEPLAAAPGGLDPTFAGGAGRTRVGRGPAFEACEALVLTPDGRSVSVGSSQAGSERAIALIRRHVNGAPDPTFGTGGTVLTRVPGRTIFGHAVALQADGKVVVAGEFLGAGGYDFLLLRYTTAGALDATFGTGGIVVTDLGGDDRADGLAVQPDGRIVVAGGSRVGGNSMFAAVRYLANGTPDASFGNQGVVLDDIGDSLDDANAVAVLDDGTLLLAGSTFNPITAVNRLALLKLTASGARDLSFSQDGVQSTTFGGPNDIGRAVVVQQGNPDKLVIAATSGMLGGNSVRFAVARYSLGGQLDYTFDGNGRLTVQPLGLDGGATGLDIQYDPDGTPRILVTGPCAGNRLTVLRRLDNGDADPTFDDDGVYQAPVVAGGEIGCGVRVIGTTIVAAGTRMLATSSHAEFLETRLTPSGVPVPGFDGDGVRVDAIGRSDPGRVALAVQPDGRLLVATNGVADPGPFSLYRLRIDGTPDPTFGAMGVAPGFASLANAVVGMALQPDGRIVVGSDGCFVARYLPNGAPDPAYGTGGIGWFSKCVEATCFGRQPDGRCLLGGRSDDHMAATRLDIDGAPDDDFGSSGLALDDSWPQSHAAALVVDSDGGFLLAGWAAPDGEAHAALMRFTANGLPDQSFGSGGRVLTPLGDDSRIEAVLLQPDGRVVAAGVSEDGLVRSLVLLRYTAGGVLDATFGEGGVARPTPNVDLDQPLAMAYENDGKILLVGTRTVLAPDAWGGLVTTHDVVAAAFLANGARDDTYATGGVAVIDLGEMTDDVARGVAFDPLQRAVIAAASSGEVGVARLRTGTTTGVPAVDPPAVGMLRVGRPAPNPARHRAALAIDVAAAAVVRVDVFDAAGRPVRALLEAPLGPGRHEVAWDVRDDAGRRVANGVYFVRVSAGSARRAVRVTVVG